MSDETSSEEGNEEIVKAITDLLKRKGKLQEFKANLRGEVFSCLSDDDELNRRSIEMPSNVSLAYSLIIDFLSAFELNSSRSVLIEESIMSKDDVMSRFDLSKKLGLKETDSDTNDKVPLLVSLLDNLLANKKN